MSTATRRIPLYEPDFAQNPHAAYQRMREQFGPLVPVDLAPGVPATLVVGYEEARRILGDPQRFPADPRRWQTSVPDTCPVRPMMEWRPNALRSAGAEHTRYRAANTAALAAVDQHALRDHVELVAEQTINAFKHGGKADLLSQYAWPLAFQTLSHLLGCPDEVGHRIADGMAKIFDGVNASIGNQIMAQAVADLVALRRREPGDDVTSRLIVHVARLDDTEMGQQLITLYGAGIEPLTNLITNTLLEMLTNSEFSGDLHAGDASVREALDSVLYRDPPLANFAMTYPPRPADIGGYLLPADQPVVISYAACNNDPALGGHRPLGNRAHLAWGAGPHGCPASSHAYLIAEAAILHILDALPEMDLDGHRDDLVWRPGPFHRSLVALPVTFPSS
ncbi:MULTISPECIES: cytochrome P450 [unclassified Streptomyces]|uniref:cytochrome P450 n=1 Tax=unclassified Streptomyces TaxID=2593676 RepID=UPI00236649C7|nr:MULTISPECIES: cytochrome P450 [unclassified Streptomyces]MDF3140973.1 cytochrome P450 [Streptomyces sp. T21Q-yed]WDF43633.1 cytochrome P450 [Streptomyces sp. T12]